MSLETYAYGDHDLQTVTVARPYPAPVLDSSSPEIEPDSGYWVVLIHGGAWRDPTQTATTYLTPALSILTSPQAKVTTSSQSPKPITGLASISYRLSPHPSHPQTPDENVTPHTAFRNAKHPAHLEDVQSALKFLQEKFGFGGRYIIVGHSCGATLALQSVMGSLSGGRKGNGYETPIAILGMAGIYNLRLLRDQHKGISAYQEFIEGAFGKDETVWDAVSPGVGGVDGWDSGRVVVLAQSKRDSLVDETQSEGMKKVLGSWETKGSKAVHFLEIEGEHDEAWEKGTELARGILFTIEKLQEMGL
ncbi:Alpha/Beta hydrolase protein [Aspergillus karnatakaensis]|uniref:arylformamidase n=1 Tax=Aspergillus karnatakaensis TaxID=1810916 RepID=UPI003CCCF65A